MFSFRWESLQIECYAHIWGSKLRFAIKVKVKTFNGKSFQLFRQHSCHWTLLRCVSNFSSEKKSWKLQSKSADGIQMLIHTIRICRNLQLLLRTQNCHTSPEYWPTLLERFFYAFVCVCDQKISYDFRNTHSAALWLHSMNTHPKKVFIDRNKAKKCSLQINLCIQQKATHMKTVTNFTFPDSQTKTRFSCKFSGIWVSSPEKN